jgi:hypothetical protein
MTVLTSQHAPMSAMADTVIAAHSYTLTLETAVTASVMFNKQSPTTNNSTDI